MRLTTSSEVNIGAIQPPRFDARAVCDLRSKRSFTVDVELQSVIRGIEAD
jgi:hypothetical protein